MLLFACGLMMLATTDAKIPLKGISLLYSYRLTNLSVVLKIIIHLFHLVLISPPPPKF